MTEPLSLNEQILAAERRVVARDQAMREELHRLGSALRSETATGVRRGAVGLVATLSVLAVAGLVGRRVRREPRRARSALQRARADDDASAVHPAAAVPAAMLLAQGLQQALSARSHARPKLPWPALVATLWPLMPAALKRRVSPQSASILVGLATALAVPWWSRRQARRCGHPQPAREAGRGHEP